MTQMIEFEKPQLVMKPGAGRTLIDDKATYWLQYTGKQCPLSQTQSALLLRGGIDIGLNLEDASEERAALTRITHKIISDRAAATSLFRLRRTIEKIWGNELTLPSQSTRANAPVRLWTRAELEQLNAIKKAPGYLPRTLIDERGIQHLFIKGKSIFTRKKEGGISPHPFALMAILLTAHGGICWDNRDREMWQCNGTEDPIKKLFRTPIPANPDDGGFKMAWRALTGATDINLASLRVNISTLRKPLREVGLRITESQSGRGKHRSYDYRLIDLATGEPPVFISCSPPLTAELT